ncbi:MAG TPA: hypothetical protein HA263_07990 [Methanoregulaceae archaeon]|nr:hypothetical protein [Methanoregulaceae archaeon]
MANLGDLVYRIICKDETQAPMDAAARRISGAGIAIGAGVAAAGVAATALIDANRPMEASFKTTALSMGVSDEAIKELARGLQSVDSPISEVAATLDLLARGGMTNVDAMGKTASAFDTLADATGQPADTLTDAMIPAFAALGISLDQAPGQVDGLAAMFRSSKVDLGDFSTLMTRMGPDLGKMGLGLSDVEAILMSFADKGITGRKATSELSKAIEASGGSTDGLYKALGMTADEVAKYSAELATSTGTAEEFAKAQNSSFGTMDKLGFEFEKIKQGLGDVLKPFEGVAAAAMIVGPAIMAVVPAAVSLAGAIAGGGGLAVVVGGLGTAVTAAAAGLVAFLAPLIAPIAVIVAIVAALYLLNKQFNFVGGIIEWLSGIWKGFASWLGDTFGPIIDGIAGFFGDLFGEMKGGVGPIEMVLAGFKSLGEWIGAVGGVIGSVLGPAIRTVATWIGETLGPVIKTVVGFFADLWGQLNEAGGVFERVRDVIVAAWNVIANLFGGGDGNGVVAAIAGLWDAIVAYVPVAWGFVQQAVVTAVAGIGSWLAVNAPPLIVAAAQAIWTALTVTIPQAWVAIQTAVVTAAGLIWTWLSTEGLRLAGEAMAGIWAWLCANVPLAWQAIQTAVVTAAQAIWDWMTDTGPGLGVAAIGAVWSAIAGAVPAAWEAIKSAVMSAANAVWNAAADILDNPFSFQIPDLVGMARSAWDSAADILSRALPAPSAQAPVYGPQQEPGSTGGNGSGNGGGNGPDGGRYVNGHYIGPGQSGYWNNGDWVTAHTGGIFQSQPGTNEGLALLLNGERILSPGETKAYDALGKDGSSGIAAAVADGVSRALSSLGLGGVTIHGDVKLSADYPYESFIAGVRQDFAATRMSRGIRT